jgi:hypothetical protein
MYMIGSQFLTTIKRNSLFNIKLTNKTIRKIAMINSDAGAIGDSLVKINETTYLVTT